jgi:beta-lactam-binding protein with PASTA domain
VEPPAEPPPSTFELAHLVGTVFAGRFRVLRLVSEGSAMALYDVEDTSTGRAVTLKLVRPELAASPTFRERFDEQMRAVSTLSHPNIAAVYDWGIAPLGAVSTAYVVVEQLTGGSLRHMFDRGRRLSPSQALVVGLDACRGLDYAHRRGFVHTELTPSKLVFGDDRRLRIVDFGLARLLGEPQWTNLEQIDAHIAWYAAPEQAQAAMADGQIDGKADVYALCLMLHEAVTGNLPFKSDSAVATLAAKTGRLMPVSADLGALAAVLERAGRPDPAERASAAEFGKMLVAAASKLPRPEPLPLFATGLFDVAPDEMRSPDDPTGGVHRPGERTADPEAPTEVLVVPVDEPDPRPEAEPAAASPGAPERAVPASPVIVEAEPELDLSGDAPPTDAAGGLVILPLDTGIAESADSARPAAAAPEPVRSPRPRQTAPTEAIPAVAVIDQRAPRRRFPWKIVVSLFVIAALVVLGVLATRLFRTPSYVVPNLVGMPEAEARNLIAANGWDITKQTERNDEVPEIGAVVRTAPAAGVELAEGEPFLMVVSEGPTLRPLPDSTALPLAEAQIALDRLGLTSELIEEFHEVVPDGTVIRWSVPADPTLVAGSEVLPGTVVQLVVSQGPAPRVVPDLTGVPVDGARVDIESRQLAFTVTGEEFHDTIPAGAVISQSIAPQTEVTRGTEIAVVVSRGPDVVPFPELPEAITYEAAEVILRDAGFNPVLVFGDRQGAVRSYTIEGETPTAGQTFRRGTTVEFEALSP